MLWVEPLLNCPASRAGEILDWSAPTPFDYRNKLVQHKRRPISKKLGFDDDADSSVNLLLQPYQTTRNIRPCHRVNRMSSSGLDCELYRCRIRTLWHMRKGTSGILEYKCGTQRSDENHTADEIVVKFYHIHIYIYLPSFSFMDLHVKSGNVTSF